MPSVVGCATDSKHTATIVASRSMASVGVLSQLFYCSFFYLVSISLIVISLSYSLYKYWLLQTATVISSWLIIIFYYFPLLFFFFGYYLKWLILLPGSLLPVNSFPLHSSNRALCVCVWLTIRPISGRERTSATPNLLFLSSALHYLLPDLTDMDNSTTLDDMTMGLALITRAQPSSYPPNHHHHHCISGG